MNSNPYGVAAGDTLVTNVIAEPAAPDSSSPPTMFSNIGKRQKVIIYAVCIFISYFCFGLLQEKITRGNYGDKDKSEKFQSTMALVFVQCLVNAIYAKIVMNVTTTQPVRDTTKTIYYALGAFTYLTAMVCSNAALKHVNYPTQVVGKSCKPIPVMILGVLLSHKRYSLQKYLFVFMIVFGVAMFLYQDKKATSSSAFTLGVGEILLLISLTMDGLTGAFQDRMKTEHQTKSGPMMLNMNFWSVIFLGIAIVFTGEGTQFISFVQRHPYVISHLLSLAIASALGQFFIFLTVTEFGPLTCSIITTTRKFFTVLGSVIFFGNVLNPRQWLGTSLVFTGLGLDSIYGH
uniref:Sugar phosphate transporter domain-containing protein n=1 Tax=Strigamia maritima TaxID=126957 RepID=T1J0P0_STRMM